jgi:hypothetical protein
MRQISPDEFEVDLPLRKVVHKPSGIWFEFYEYPNEEDWERTDSVVYHDKPEWSGDRLVLAAAAKDAAIKKGMKARRPAA